MSLIYIFLLAFYAGCKERFNTGFDVRWTNPLYYYFKRPLCYYTITWIWFINFKSCISGKQTQFNIYKMSVQLLKSVSTEGKPNTAGFIGCKHNSAALKQAHRINNSHASREKLESLWWGKDLNRGEYHENIPEQIQNHQSDMWWKITSRHFSLHQVVPIHGLPADRLHKSQSSAAGGGYSQDVATREASGVELCATQSSQRGARAVVLPFIWTFFIVSFISQ